MAATQSGAGSRDGAASRARPGGHALSGLLVMKIVDTEMLKVHRDERLHKLGLGVLGQLGCLLDQRFDLVVGRHINSIVTKSGRADEWRDWQL